MTSSVRKQQQNVPLKFRSIRHIFTGNRNQNAFNVFSHKTNKCRKLFMQSCVLSENHQVFEVADGSNLLWFSGQL